MDQIIAFFGSNYSLIERFFNLFNPFNPALGLPRRFLNFSVLLVGVAIFLGTISYIFWRAFISNILNIILKLSWSKFPHLFAKIYNGRRKTCALFNMANFFY